MRERVGASILVAVAGAIAQPLGAQTVTLTEGTWISVDVSPDGQTMVFDLLGDLYLLPIAGGTARPLRIGPAFDAQPRFSPNGLDLVFVSDEDGADNVWVLPLSGGSPRRLSSVRVGTVFSPAWTPDGRAVLATIVDGSGVAEMWRLPVEGGAGERVGRRTVVPPSPLVSSAYPGAYGPTPTPDGRTVYYTAVEPRQYRSLEGPKASIIGLDLATGLETMVVSRSTNALKPAISPNGRWLVYATQHRGTTALRVRDLEGDSDRRLLTSFQRDELEARASRDVLPNLAFLPDGSAVIAGYQGKLRRIDLRTGASRVIPFSVAVDLGLAQKPPRVAVGVEDGPVRASAIGRSALAPDGQRIAFPAFSAIYLRDLAGGLARRLTSTTSPREFEPAWSPDGDWVAFVTWRADSGGHLWKVRASGVAAPVRLTDRAAFYSDIAWSPDGAWLVAQSAPTRARLDQAGLFAPLAESSLITIAASGGPATRLGPGEGLGRPHFGPGGRIYASTPRGELVSFDARGGGRRVELALTATRPAFPPAQVEEIVISPTGGTVVALVATLPYLVPVPHGPSATPIDVRAAGNGVVLLDPEGADAVGWNATGSRLFWQTGRRITTRTLEGSPSSIEVEAERPRARAPGTVVLRGGTVITMAGTRIVPNADLVVTDGRIVRVGPRRPTAPATRVIDVSGKYLVPGLVDIHAHWEVKRGVLDLDNWSAAANLAYGVTTIRDPQSFNTDIFRYRDLVETGDMIGPRIFSAGRGLYGLDFRTAEEVRHTLTRYRDRYGTRLIKSYMVGNREQRRWVAEASRAMGLLATTEGGADLRMDLTHAIDGFAGNEHALPTAPIYRDVVELFAHSGTVYTPTLLVAFGGPFASLDFFARERVVDDEKLARFIPWEVLYPRATKRLAWTSPDDFHYPAVAAGAAAILRAGGHVALGSHGELEGLGNHWELRALAKGGMTPRELLRVATIEGARAIGVETNLGSIEPGKLADVLVLDHNPLHDVRHLAAIRYVIKDGIVYRAETLDQVWPQTKAFGLRWWGHTRPAGR